MFAEEEAEWIGEVGGVAAGLAIDDEALELREDVGREGFAADGLVVGGPGRGGRVAVDVPCFFVGVVADFFVDAREVRVVGEGVVDCGVVGVLVREVVCDFEGKGVVAKTHVSLTKSLDATEHKLTVHPP